MGSCSSQIPEAQVVKDRVVPVYYRGKYAFATPCPVPDWAALRSRAAATCGVAIADQKWAALEFGDHPRVRPLDEKCEQDPDGFSLARADGRGGCVVSFPPILRTSAGVKYRRHTPNTIAKGFYDSDNWMNAAKAFIRGLYGTQDEIDFWAPINERTDAFPDVLVFHVRVTDAACNSHVDLCRVVFVCRNVPDQVKLVVKGSKFEAWAGEVLPGLSATTVLRGAEVALGLDPGYLKLVAGENAQVFGNTALVAETPPL